MRFRDAVSQWFDQDHLMSRRPNPGPGEEGNPILETGTAYCFLSWLNELEPADTAKFYDAISALKSDEGLPNKKPRSTDLITHDDLIGLCAGSAAVRCTWRAELIAYGQEHGWNFSNNGENTWTSNAKPWHRAFYLMSANLPVALWDKILLTMSIVVNALTSMDSASGKRLNYLIVKTIRGQSLICDLAILLWWWRIRRVYGSARRIFIMYHGEKHPFSLFCPD